MRYCFIFWRKGNLYGTLIIKNTREEANKERLEIGRQKGKDDNSPLHRPYEYEVSAVAEIE